MPEHDLLRLSGVLWVTALVFVLLDWGPQPTTVWLLASAILLIQMLCQRVYRRREHDHTGPLDRGRSLLELCLLGLIALHLGPLAALLLPLQIMHASLWMASRPHHGRALLVALIIVNAGLPLLVGQAERLASPAFWGGLLALLIAPQILRILLARQESSQESLRADLEKMRSDTEARAAFLSGISHELRTPMNGVLGITRILAELDLSPSARYYVNVLQQSAQSLLYIVNDVLDYSKIGAGKLRLERQAFNLAEALREVLNLLEPVASQNLVSLHHDYPKGALEQFIGDPVRIKQIVFNIVGNAIKFAPGGRVSLSVTVRDLRQDLHEVILFIRDNGEGIPPERLQHLFKPYSQARDHHATMGTGLGLCIARQLASRMWGDVTVSSQPGVGTTFRVSLKLEATRLHQRQEASRTQAPVQPAKKMALPACRVLLAEDNPVNQIVARSVLRKLGLEVSIVSDGRQALDALAVHPYDLLLLDLEMPVMDGFEAAMSIRSDPSHAAMPVVALTANVDEDCRQKALDSGFDRVLHKPLDPVLLRQLLEELHTPRMLATRIAHP